MYTLKKEFKGQNVTVYTPNKQIIKLESATQDEFKIAYEIKGNEKFISKVGKQEKKEVEEIIKEEVEEKPVVKRGRPKA